MNQEQKFFILIFSFLSGLFTYFLIKLYSKFKRNGATWRQIFTGYWTGHKCQNKLQCASNNCQLNICMV